MKCVRKEQYEYIYLTKQNREEVLKIFEPNIDTVWKSIIKDNDRYFIVENPLYKTVYYYNNWYIPDVYSCERYTDEEFKEEFELVGE